MGISVSDLHSSFWLWRWIVPRNLIVVRIRLLFLNGTFCGPVWQRHLMKQTGFESLLYSLGHNVVGPKASVPVTKYRCSESVMEFHSYENVTCSHSAEGTACVHVSYFQQGTISYTSLSLFTGSNQKHDPSHQVAHVYIAHSPMLLLQFTTHLPQ
jgi:hypothetical protein